MRRDINDPFAAAPSIYLNANPIHCAVGSQMQQPLGVHLPW